MTLSTYASRDGDKNSAGLACGDDDTGHLYSNASSLCTQAESLSNCTLPCDSGCIVKFFLNSEKNPSQCRCTEPDTPSCPPGQISTTATESLTSAYTSQSTDSSASALSTNASLSITSTPSLSSTLSYTLSSVGPSSGSSNDTSLSSAPQPARAVAHLNVGAIVGGTIGGMVLLMLMLGLLLYRQRKAHRAPPSAEFLEMGIGRTTPALSVDAKIPPRDDGRPSSRADGLPGYGHGGSFSVDEKSPMVPVGEGYGVAE